MRFEYDLDVLKPHSPSIDYIARALVEVNGVLDVRVKLVELDQKTASLQIHITGDDLSLEVITEKLTSLNCAIHSVDEISICEKEDT